MSWVPKDNSLTQSVLNRTDWVFRLKCRSCDESFDCSYGGRETEEFKDFCQYATSLKQVCPIWWQCDYCDDLAAMDIVAISTLEVPE